MLLFARAWPGAYREAMQEDRATEWLTVALFLAAAVSFGVRAVRQRRVWDALLGAFCVVSVGEEISWGQRLLGFVPARQFLEHNTQQEANLHNLVEAFGQPKWTLIALLLAYGVVLPLVLRIRPAERMLQPFGVQAPAAPLRVWFVLASALLMIYPVRYAGEWIEALVGGLFLASSNPRARVLPAVGIASAVFAFAMQALTARARAGDAAFLHCARDEAEVLAAEVGRAAAMRGALPRVHRRLWTESARSWLSAPALDAALARVPCPPSSADDLARRRPYLVDPWGTAYWLRVSRDSSGERLEIYSFGPNRRRDRPGSGDDIAAVRRTER